MALEPISQHFDPKSYSTPQNSSLGQVLRSGNRNLPPKWHLSFKKKDRSNVALRIRKYSNLIEVVDWMVHQYGEHKSLYDKSSLKKIFQEAGFKSFKKVK